MEQLNQIIAKNIVKYRTIEGLTQKELSEKLNYSDKSISKWERGEGMPDISVLVEMAAIFNITVNDLIDPRVLKNTKEYQSKKLTKRRHLVVTVLSSGLVWLIAATIFVTLLLSKSPRAWMTFIYATPVCGVVLLVFSSIWGKSLSIIGSTTILLWGLVVSICLSIQNENIWLICIIGAILEMLLSILFIYIDKVKIK